MLRSRVLTFHIESDHVNDVVDALDRVRERFAGNPDFRGLLCLEGPGVRHEIMVLTLWDGDGFDAMQSEDEQARQQIAESCDVGVRSAGYDVLRHFTPVAMPSELAPRGLCADNVTPFEKVTSIAAARALRRQLRPAAWSTSPCSATE